MTVEIKSQEPLAKPGTKNLEAYSLYVKGRALLYRRGVKVSLALECFNQAVALDSEYALSNRVFDVLKQRCGEKREGWVFPSKRAESAHLTTMAKRFREARVKAGLPEDLVLYCGRHDYGTRILRRTGNLAAVMRTMGHKDVKTAMQYQHPELEIVRAALDQDTAAVEKRA